jgi:hypothetical protein
MGTNHMTSRISSAYAAKDMLEDMMKELSSVQGIKSLIQPAITSSYMTGSLEHSQSSCPTRSGTRVWTFSSIS